MFTRKPSSAARSTWRFRMARGDTATGVVLSCSSTTSHSTSAVRSSHGTSRSVVRSGTAEKSP